ncbi:MAG: hypothetical protein IAE91_05290 [Ignavibacteriaceae bacterium]|nr:hypothetical protein [Ignavibacteriaceae bacterium]
MMYAIYNKFFFIFFLIVSTTLSQSVVNYSFQSTSEKSLQSDVEYVITYWNSENGLPQNTVRDLVQTDDGFIWMATSDGLVRFDGIKFEIFKSIDYPELGSNRIAQLVAGDDGRIWIVTEFGKLLYFKNHRFYSVPQIDNSLFIGRILLDSYNNLCMFVPSLGIVISKIENYKQIDTIYRSDNNTQILSFSITSAGEFFILIKNKNKNQLIFFDKNYSITKKVDTDFNFEFHTQIGNVDYLQTDKGLHILKNGSLYPHGSTKYVKSRAYSISSDKDSSLWVSTEEGLFIFKKNIEAPLKISSEHGLLSTHILKILMDKEGIMWTGTSNAGVQKFTKKLFKVVTGLNTATNSTVNPLLELADGSVLAGFSCFNLLKITGNRVSKFGSDIQIHCQWALANSKSGIIYLGTLGVGLKFLDPTGKVIKTIDNKDGLISNDILSLQELPGGELLIGSLRGLSIYKDGVVKNITSGNSGLDNPVAGFFIDSKNRCLVLTASGLFEFILSDMSLIPLSYENTNVKIVRAIHEFKDNTYLIGTYGYGLFYYDGNSFKNLTTKNGLFDNIISSIIPDNFGRLWMTCNNGLFYINENELKSFFAGSTDFVTSISFNRNDGLLSNEFNGGFTSSGLKLKDGRLAFPSLNGVVFVDPALIPQNLRVQNMNIVSISTDEGIFYDENKFIELSPSTKRVTVNYSAILFSNSSQIRFIYKLDGFDTEWKESGLNNFASYTNLEPGKYEFFVRAFVSNKNEFVEASLIINILPPFYKTWWFQLISAIFILFIIAFVYRARLDAIQQEKEKLENLVQLRTNELKLSNRALEAKTYELEQHKSELEAINVELSNVNIVLETSEKQLIELNKNKDLFLTIVSHDLKNPIFAISVYSDILIQEYQTLKENEFKEILININESSTNLNKLIEKFLHWARLTSGRIEFSPTGFSIYDTLNEVLTILKQNLLQKKLTVELFVSSSTIVFADHNMIVSVLQNIIGNAIKFSHTGDKITINSTIRENDIELSIRDEGVGMSPLILSKLFDVQNHHSRPGTNNEKGTGVGLILAKDMVEKNGGRIWAESKENSGTIFYVSLPIYKVHVNGNKTDESGV